MAMVESSPVSSGTRPGNMSAVVVAQLRDAILDGFYAPGQRLIENDLIASFGSSRGPVREALRRLAAEGVVELVPNRGAIVKRLSHKELVDLFRMCETLEGLAARTCAERVRAQQAPEAFAQALADVGLSALPPPGMSFPEANRLFHQVLVDFSQNAQLKTTLDQMRIPLVRLQFRAAIDAEYQRASMAEHRQVVAAVLAGDPVAAETAMRNHLEQAGSRLLVRPGEEPSA